MSEIEQAINQGKEVITHTDAVTVPGYMGAGYIILDPITGDGAYKIAGGENGGKYKPQPPFSVIDEFLLLMGALLGDQFNFLLNKLGGVSKFIQTITKTLLFASLFTGITNSYFACKNTSDFLGMYLIHIITTALLIVISSIIPGGILIAAALGLFLDVMIKPEIQNLICENNQ